MKNPKRFQVTITLEVEIEEAVLAEAAKPDWQEHLYKLDREGVAGMIGSCLYRGSDLSDLDGFADRKDEEARIVARSIDVETEEITPAAIRTARGRRP